MNVFEKSLRELFGSSHLLQDPKYTGRTCLARLDKDLRVKLSFVENGVAGEYTAICASIINRKDGLVDKQIFRFRDMVPPRQTSQAFGRQYPYIWEYQGNPEWYGPPISVKEKQLVRDTVLDYDDHDRAVYVGRSMKIGHRCLRLCLFVMRGDINI